MPDEPPRGRGIGELLAAARAGSNEALGRLLECCRDYLLHMANQELDSDLRTKESPSDMVQQTFLEARKDFGRFQGGAEEEWRAWLTKILAHNIANCRRSYRDTQKRQLDREVPLDGLQGVLPGSDLTPSGILGQKEERQELEAALSRLTTEYRQVVLLRYQDKRSFEEIGQIMNRSPDAARKLWSRAVEKLAEELE